MGICQAGYAYQSVFRLAVSTMLDTLYLIVIALACTVLLALFIAGVKFIPAKQFGYCMNYSTLKTRKMNPGWHVLRPWESMIEFTFPSGGNKQHRIDIFTYNRFRYDPPAYTTTTSDQVNVTVDLSVDYEIDFDAIAHNAYADYSPLIEDTLKAALHGVTRKLTLKEINSDAITSGLNNTTWPVLYDCIKIKQVIVQRIYFDEDTQRMLATLGVVGGNADKATELMRAMNQPFLAGGVTRRGSMY